MFDLDNGTSCTDNIFTDVDTNNSTANFTDNKFDARNFRPNLNVPYVVMELLVALIAIIGNAIVIIVFYRERKLRKRTNYYIISLALSDFLGEIRTTLFAFTS